MRLLKGIIAMEIMEKTFYSACPYCGSNDIEALDSFDDSEKWRCCECGEDFIHWFEDDSVTDRHNFPIARKICLHKVLT